MFSFLKKALIPDTEEKVRIASTDADPITTNDLVPDLKLSNDSISRTESSTSNGDSTANDTVSVDNHPEALDRTALKGIVTLEDSFKSLNVFEAVMSSAEDLPREDHNQPKIATAMPDKSVVASKTDSGNHSNIAHESYLTSKVGAESLTSSSSGTTHIAPTADVKEVSTPLLKPSTGASQTESTVSKVETAAEIDSIDFNSNTSCKNATVISLEKDSDKKGKEHEGKHEKNDVNSGTLNLTHTVANAENDHPKAESSIIEDEMKPMTVVECEISEVDISNESAVLIPKGIDTSVDVEGMRVLSPGDNGHINSAVVESIPESQKISSSHPQTAPTSGALVSTSAQTPAESVIIKIEKVSTSEASKENTKVDKETLKNESDLTEPCDAPKDFVTNVVKSEFGKGVTESVEKISSECSAKTGIQNVPMTDVPKNTAAVNKTSNGSHPQEKEIVIEKVVIDLNGDDDDDDYNNSVTVGSAAKATGTGTGTGAGKAVVTTSRSYPHVVDLTGDSPDEGEGKDPVGAQTGQGTGRKWAPGLEVWETCLNELVELEAMAVAGKLDHEGSDTEEGESEAYGGGSDDMTEDIDGAYGARYEDEGKDEEYSGYSLSDEEEDSNADGGRNKVSTGVSSRGEEEDDEAAEVYIGDDDEMVSYEDNAEEFEAQGSESGPKFSGFASEQEAPSRDVSPLPPTIGGASDKLPIDAYREVILERIKVTKIMKL